MRCEELRVRLSDGGELDASARDHLAACESCREEQAWLAALLASKPMPHSAPPRLVRRCGPFLAAGVAAAFLVALGTGYVLGGFLHGPPPVEYVDRPVERIVTVATPPTDDQIAVLAIALQSLYKRYVQVEWEGLVVRRVHMDPVVLEADVCPLAREAGRVANQRTDIFDLR